MQKVELDGWWSARTERKRQLRRQAVVLTPGRPDIGRRCRLSKYGWYGGDRRCDQHHAGADRTIIVLIRTMTLIRATGRRLRYGSYALDFVAGRKRWQTQIIAMDVAQRNGHLKG